MNGFRVSLGFLTVLPIGKRGELAPGGLGRSAGWFPSVGMVLGAILVLVWGLARWLFPQPAAAALVVLAWAMLTGGLHLDGLADCCDGLFMVGTRERRLQILRDPRLGAFGAIGLVLFLTLKVAAVAAVRHPWPLLLAPVLGRLAILHVAVRRPARPSGLAKEFQSGLRPRILLTATLTAALVSGVFASLGLLSFLLAALAAVCIGRYAERQVGGVTGDVLGMACEVAELLVLFVGASRLG